MLTKPRRLAVESLHAYLRIGLQAGNKSNVVCYGKSCVIGSSIVYLA